MSISPASISLLLLVQFLCWQPEELGVGRMPVFESLPPTCALVEGNHRGSGISGTQGNVYTCYSCQKYPIGETVCSWAAWESPQHGAGQNLDWLFCSVELVSANQVVIICSTATCRGWLSKLFPPHSPASWNVKIFKIPLHCLILAK